MAKLPLTIKISKDAHLALKNNQTSLGSRIDNLLLHADLNDLLTALTRRYNGDDVPAPVEITTKALVSQAAIDNADVITLHTGISRDLLLRLLLENHLAARTANLDNTLGPDVDVDNNPDNILGTGYTPPLANPNALF